MTPILILMLLAVAAGVWYRAHGRRAAAQAVPAAAVSPDDALVNDLIANIQQMSREDSAKRAKAAGLTRI